MHEQLHLLSLIVSHVRVQQLGYLLVPKLIHTWHLLVSFAGWQFWQVAEIAVALKHIHWHSFYLHGIVIICNQIKRTFRALHIIFYYLRALYNKQLFLIKKHSYGIVEVLKAALVIAIATRNLVVILLFQTIFDLKSTYYLVFILYLFLFVLMIHYAYLLTFDFLLRDTVLNLSG